MDFNSYYLNQATNNVFRGAPVQRGYGLGGAFRKFFSWALPILKETLRPTLQNLGKEVIGGVSNFANDTLQGKDIESSAKQRFRETIQNLKGQSGKGYKRKRHRQIGASKKIKDIFD